MLRGNRKAINRKGTVVAVIGLILLVAVPAMAAPSVVQQINGGERSTTVTGATLQSIEYSHADQVAAGTISLTVDDRSGSGAGWSVTLQAGDFVDGNRTIPASNFSIVNAHGAAHLEGQEIDPAGGPNSLAETAQGSLDVPRKILRAQEGFGVGAYSQDLDVQLLVPGQTLAGSYGTNLTIDITAGP